MGVLLMGVLLMGVLLIGVCLRGFQIFLIPPLSRTSNSTERLASERLKFRYFGGTWSETETFCCPRNCPRCAPFGERHNLAGH